MKFIGAEGTKVGMTVVVSLLQSSYSQLPDYIKKPLETQMLLTLNGMASSLLCGFLKLRLHLVVSLDSGIWFWSRISVVFMMILAGEPSLNEETTMETPNNIAASRWLSRHLSKTESRPALWQVIPSFADTRRLAVYICGWPAFVTC